MKSFDYRLLVPLTIVVAIVWLVRWLLRSGEALQKAERARLAAARPGRARIVNAESSGVVQGVSRNPLVRLDLEVHPEVGAPYAASTAWFVDIVAVPRVQPGLELAVKIDAEDPGIVYPVDTWAKYDAALVKVALGLKRI